MAKKEAMIQPGVVGVRPDNFAIVINTVGDGAFRAERIVDRSVSAGHLETPM